MITHLEPLVDAAIATLRAGLGDRLAVIDSTLELPAGYYPGGLPTPALAYPAVEVSAPDGQLAGFSIQQEASDAFDTLIVCCWVQHVDYETLYRRTLRYGAAILETLLQPEAFGAGSWVDPDRGVRYAYRANPETGEKQQRTAAALSVWYLQHGETRG